MNALKKFLSLFRRRTVPTKEVVAAEDKAMEISQEKMLKNANKIFDDLNRKMPLYMKPFRAAKLDHNGFRWIRNAPDKI